MKSIIVMNSPNPTKLRQRLSEWIMNNPLVTNVEYYILTRTVQKGLLMYQVIIKYDAQIIRPDRLIEYKPEWYPETTQHGRWDSNGNHMVMGFDPDMEFLNNMKEFNELWDSAMPKFRKGQIRNPVIIGTEGGIPRGKITMINGTTIKFPSILQYWDSRLDYTENLKLQKEFDNMMFGNPFKEEDFNNVPKYRKCNNCEGTGTFTSESFGERCNTCKGSGSILIEP